MKFFSTSSLLIGDLIIIGLFGFFRIFHYSSPPQPLFDLSIAVAPYLLAWLLISPRLMAIEPFQQKGAFLRHSLLAWLAASLVSEVTRTAILWFSFRTIHMPLASLFSILEGALWVLAWRIAFKIVYDLTSNAVHPLIRRATWVAIFALFGLSFLLVLPFAFTAIRYSNKIFQISTVPEVPVAFVLGAGIYPNGTPSRVLVERMNAAVYLFRTGKVSQLILSGDSREGEAMYKLAVDAGLPEDTLIVDPAGYDTYISCSRMKTEFRISQVVLISQRYHLPRAIFTCERLGIKAVGLAAENPPYSLRTLTVWYLREIPATALAWWLVVINQPTSK